MPTAPSESRTWQICFRASATPANDGLRQFARASRICWIPRTPDPIRRLLPAFRTARLLLPAQVVPTTDADRDAHFDQPRPNELLHRSTEGELNDQTNRTADHP